VDEQSNFRMKLAKGSKRGERHLNEIANAANINENLIRAFFGKASAKLANHGRPVLPPFVRLSTIGRGSGYSQ
jgi:hypothetical protein